MRDPVFGFKPEAPSLPALDRALRADFVVVGGGMMGLMCAMAAVARGQRVCLLEAETCGAGASGRSSGLVTPDSELELRDLVQQFGTETARKLWEFASDGVGAIRRVVEDERIECGMQLHDALFVATTRGGFRTIRDEHDARNNLGYSSTLHSREDLPSILGSETYFGGLEFAGTLGIDAYDCCVGLRQRLLDRGAQVFERSPVTRILESGVETPAGSVQAAAVVVCADRFLPTLGLARREVYHVQTFLAVSERLADSDIHRMFPKGPLLVWGSDVTYTYFRLTGDGRLLIGGCSLANMYSPRQQERPGIVARKLKRYLARRFPDVRIKVAACWPGLIGISKDFAPVLGRHPRYRAVHFAAASAGLPWAAALGRYLADKVLDGRSELDGTLSVDRGFPVGPRLQAVVRAPIAFAISHGMLKYLRQ